MGKYSRPNVKEAFEIYLGRSIEQMPRLIADGRVPINVAQLMQRQLDVINSDAEVKAFWMDNYFHTGDAVVYHPGGDGRVKIVLDSQTLREMTPESPRNGGALVLTEDVYRALQGEEFKKGKLGKTNTPLSRAKVKAHPVWKTLARDQRLLNDYADHIFAEGKQRFGYDTAMGVYPHSTQGNTPEMRVWYVGRLVGRSFVDGRGNLLDEYSRFVGIAPEAQSAKILGAGKNTIIGLNDAKISKILYPKTHALRSQLEIALLVEDYEQAASLRDKINYLGEPL